MSAGLDLQLRRLILALLTFGLVAVTGELLALGHYEEPRQFVPILSLAVALLAIGWHAVSGGPATLTVLRIVMALIVLVGVTGVLLHVQGSVAFQREASPELSGWPLIYRILHAKAPPALAPGVMVQLGLLGLIYGYRHPASREPA